MTIERPPCDECGKRGVMIYGGKPDLRVWSYVAKSGERKLGRLCGICWHHAFNRGEIQSTLSAAELLKRRRESEDWAIPEYPITDEATRGAE